MNERHDLAGTLAPLTATQSGSSPRKGRAPSRPARDRAAIACSLRQPSRTAPDRAQGRVAGLSSPLVPRRGGARVAPSWAPPAPGTAHPALSRPSAANPCPASGGRTAVWTRLTRRRPGSLRGCCAGPAAYVRQRRGPVPRQAVRRPAMAGRRAGPGRHRAAGPSCRPFWISNPPPVVSAAPSRPSRPD